MNFSLENRVALVAGSTRGIGKAIAKALLSQGCRVCISGRDPSKLAETQLELEQSFGKHCIMGFHGDLTDPEMISNVCSEIQNTWSGLDVLVANVGSGKGRTGWEIEEKEWEHLFQINFWSSVRLAQSAIPLLARRRGTIVFVASIAGVEASPAPLPYSSAKAALISYAKNLAREVAKSGIRVNCVAPGNILFPMGSWERHLHDRREEVLKMIESEVPLGRFGTPEEIAQLVAFLCSERSSFITGSCFIADGGQTSRF